MRPRGLAIYPLAIPFVEAFSHSTKQRTFSDAVVVAVTDADGVTGYGEGLPRPYVTGETVATMVTALREAFWPAIADRDLPQPVDRAGLAALDAALPDPVLAGVVAPNAARAALEVALVDLALKRQGLSLGRLLPPQRRQVAYSGVITAGGLDKVVQRAKQMKLVGLAALKVKVGFADDVARVEAVRAVVGPEVSLRVDANGAWTFDQAVATLHALAPFGVAACEQPLPRGDAAELARLRQAVPVPIMVDESLITAADGQALLAAGATDYWNVRISKNGGIHRALALAEQAQAAGLKLQIGSQVGETAILSAAGRHLAAHLSEVAFVEGSFGTLLLTEDVVSEAIRFGHKGLAPVLTGPGLGVSVLPDRLAKWAQR